MGKPSKRLLRAVEKNLADLNNCILKRRAYNEFRALKSRHTLDFFRIAAHALRDDLFADAHRVFDTHKDAASLRYLRRVAPGPFNRAVKKAGVNLGELEKIANKLQPIRNRVQFHTAKKDVEVPANVWRDAGVTGNEFIRLTEEVHEVLRLMHLELSGEDRPVPDYYGKDIEQILRAYEQSMPKPQIYVPPRKPKS